MSRSDFHAKLHVHHLTTTLSTQACTSVKYMQARLEYCAEKLGKARKQGSCGRAKSHLFEANSLCDKGNVKSNHSCDKGNVKSYHFVRRTMSSRIILVIRAISSRIIQVIRAMSSHINHVIRAISSRNKMLKIKLKLSLIRVSKKIRTNIASDVEVRAHGFGDREVESSWRAKAQKRKDVRM